MLAKIIAENQRDWHEKAYIVTAAYRATVHEATQFTPNQLFFMRQNRLPIDLLLGVPETEANSHTSYNEYVAKLQQRMREMYAVVRQHLGKAAVRRKHLYDARNKTANSFEVGEYVYFYTPRTAAGRNTKWTSWFSGPFFIVRKIPPNNRVIQRSKRSRLQVVHIDTLSPFYGQPPGWKAERRRRRLLPVLTKQLIAVYQRSHVTAASRLSPARQPRPLTRLWYGRVLVTAAVAATAILITP